MGLLLTEEQEQIRREARELVRRRLPISHLRQLRDSRDPVGFSREVWKEMASLGFAGITLPAEVGGAGLGYAELGLVLEECGRTLAPTPLLSTVVFGATALADRPDELRAIAAGERIVAFAHEEGRRHDPELVSATIAEVAGGRELALSGEKRFVLDGHVADVLIVTARRDDGRIAIVACPAAAPGVSVRRTIMVDSRNAARVSFDGVRLPASSILGGRELYDRLLARGAIALSAEMFGGTCEAFERTVAYLKERHQFGKPIGSFQALKHRAAIMFCDVELCRSLVLDALRSIDHDRPDVALLSHAVKARVSETFLHVANEAIQLHGGIGVTDELDIGLFLKRARTTEFTLGDPSFHRNQYGRLALSPPGSLSRPETH